MEFTQYFYLIGISLFVPVWIMLFLKKERRRDMLFTGVILGIVATIIEHLYAKLDYWEPVFLIPSFPFEDFLYGFIFGGISSEIYESILGSRNSKRRRYPTNKKLIIFFALVAAFSFWFFIDILNLNSIIAHIIPPIIVGTIVGILRKDLFLSSIFSGLLVMTLTFVMFQILISIYPEIFINHWYLENLSGIYILRIPIEELLFGFVVGFGAANVYELIFGYTILKE